jgi:predicted RNA-binding protein (TIGR00451 family)
MNKNLSKSEIKELNDQIEKYGFSFDKKDIIVHFKDDEIEGYLKDNSLIIARKKDILFPTLKYVTQNGDLNVPSVFIDIPAVKFIVNGADIMRPGIKSMDDFSENSVVVVRDEIHKKPVCIAYSRKNSQDLKIMEKGKVLENLNYVGDKIWSHS